MKIALPIQENSTDATFNPRFGRAPFFLLVDPQTGEGQTVPNPAVGTDSGAGVQAAQLIAELGAQAVVSNRYGPKAYQTLAAAGVRMYLVKDGENASVREILKRFQEGKLGEAAGPTNRGLH